MIHKITVVMTTYNAMPYLKEAIDSILTQSFKNIELLIINDGSKDNTKAYLDLLNDPRVRIIHFEKNKGRVYALNLAIEEAKHDWILIMDADDIALPNLIEREIEFLERLPEVSLVSCGWRYIGANGRVLKTSQIPPLRQPPYFNPIIDLYIRNSGSLFLRQAAKAIGGYRDLIAEDRDFWLRLDEAGYKMACIPEILLLYRTLQEGRGTTKFIEHRLSQEYALACSLARRAGKREPEKEEYYKRNWPKGLKLLRIKGERQFRLAGAQWGNDKFIRAIGHLLLSLIFNPGLILSKYRLFFIDN